MKKSLVLWALAILTLCSSKPVKLACIGDSITYGACIEDRENDAYPAVLQRMLGHDYEVVNFGFNARTALMKGDFPYMRETMYQEVKDFLPDIVTIMLGTNDSKVHNWAYEAEFETDYKKMVSELQALPSHPRIYVCLPPAVHTDRWTIRDSVIFNHVTRHIKKVASAYWLDIIDTRPALLGKTEMFSEDGVHPNEKGAALLAEVIFEGLSKRGDTGKPGKRVLFIGDSITDDDWGKMDGHPVHERFHYDLNHIYGHGYVLNCAQYYQVKYPSRGYRFYNRGISGNTLPQILERWDSDVFTVHPDVVSLLVGINDSHINNTVESFDFDQWESQYRMIIERTAAFDKDIRMVVCTPFYSDLGAQNIEGIYSGRAPIVRRQAEIVRRLAKEYGLVCVDFAKLFDDIYAKDKSRDEKYWMWDGVHATMAGHSKMSEYWIKQVKKAGIM